MAQRNRGSVTATSALALALALALVTGAGCAGMHGGAGLSRADRAGAPQAPAQAMGASCREHMQASRRYLQAARSIVAESFSSEDPARLRAALTQVEQQLAELQAANERHEAQMAAMKGEAMGGMTCGCKAGEGAAHEH